VIARHLSRWAFREEKLPPHLLWWLAADGMRLWYRVLRSGLSPHFGGHGGAQRVLAKLAAPVFFRRYELFRKATGAKLSVEQPGVIGSFIGGLYFSPLLRASDWILGDVGGPPRDFMAVMRSQRLLRGFSARQRWEEVATHLGEILIALTRGLPGEGLRATNATLGELCFEGGKRYGQRLQRAWSLPHTPASCIEVLRVSEYVFRVNPEHWSAHDAATHTGYIEGTACPWYTAPGWSMMHCGIFGQFQSGIASVFGLRYQLTKTIPKHGGHTCRIDLKPVA
jgi:hypothetical protein